MTWKERAYGAPARSKAEPQTLGDRVAAVLTDLTGYADLVVVRSVAELRELPLERGDEVAFFDNLQPFPVPVTSRGAEHGRPTARPGRGCRPLTGYR